MRATFIDGFAAIEVKDHTAWAHDPRTRVLIETLSGDVVERIYEGVREDFWEDIAPDIAREHGYSEVWADGRSGGWLVVDGEQIEGEAFRAFAAEIDQAVSAAQHMFIQRLREHIAADDHIILGED